VTGLFPEDLRQRAAELLARYQAAGKRLATVESCTGGLVAALLTEIPGSSAVVERGFVTYSNEAKHDLVGVPLATLRAWGAVSGETAEAMALGALARAPVDVALSITGIAGPGGATAEKPLGLVYFGMATLGEAPRHLRGVFPGDRAAVRQASLRKALALLAEKAD